MIQIKNLPLTVLYIAWLGTHELICKDVLILIFFLILFWQKHHTRTSCIMQPTVSLVCVLSVHLLTDSLSSLTCQIVKIASDGKLMQSHWQPHPSSTISWSHWSLGKIKQKNSGISKRDRLIIIVLPRLKPIWIQPKILRHFSFSPFKYLSILSRIHWVYS